MINDMLQKQDLNIQFRQISKKKDKGLFDFLVLDSTKWPLKNTDYVVSFPKQIKELFEDFTQMYEKTKRGNQK